jgi:hypothetical protein
MKTDWPGTWANRVIDLHSKVMRDQKFGTAPTATAASAKPMTPEQLRSAIRYRRDNGDEDGAKEYERQLAARASPPSNIAHLVPNMRASR